MEHSLDYSLPPRELLFEARSLKEDYQYHFWVTASTNIGEGKPSRVVVLSPQSTVPAKIGSFPEKITVNRKTDVRLPCRTVGIPTPEREWKLRNQKLVESNRIKILPDGSLDIKNTMPTDSGNYTCRVENIYSTDELIHELYVTAREEKASPPNAPIIKVQSIGKTYVSLSWRVDDDGGSPIRGYTLIYKRDIDGNQWQELLLESENTTFVLKDLYCGNRYQIYMVAHNREGSSVAGKFETVNTKGFAPIVPLHDSLLTTNQTSITIHLDAWIEGGCEIKKFVIEYKQKGNFDWILVANEVVPEQKKYIIRDLVMNTSYLIRVSAISEAGISEAEYEITTVDNRKYEVPTDIISNNSSKYLPFYYNLNIIIPVAVTMIVIIVVTATVCDFMRRRQYRYPTRKGILSSFKTTVTRDTGQKPSTAEPNTQTYSPSHPAHSSGPPDDVSPYATYQLPECMPQNEDSIRMQTFSKLSIPVTNTQSSSQATVSPSGKSHYSKVRKPRPSGLPERKRYPTLPVETHPSVEETTGYLIEKHKEPPPREILRMHPFIESVVSVAPSAPPAEYDSTSESTPESNTCTLKYDQSTRSKPYHRVPDLLYHRPDSSTSNETSSPDTERGDTLTFQHNQHKESRRFSKKTTTWSERHTGSSETRVDETKPASEKSIGPPEEFNSHTKAATNLTEGKCVARTSNEEGSKNIDSVRLAAAEEELIALLKSGTPSSSSSLGYYQPTKDDFVVRV